MKDYLAAAKPDELKDAVQYGVLGMKWGRRRTDAQLRVAAKERALASATTTTASGGTETAANRYARLKQEASSGRGNLMSEEDLKFFNARTEALQKVEKLNKTNPGWLSKTSKKVLQNTAEKQMQAIADSIANKYIAGPITSALKPTPAKDAVDKTVKAIKS